MVVKSYKYCSPFQCPTCDAVRKLEKEIAKIKSLQEELTRSKIGKNIKVDIFESTQKAIPIEYKPKEPVEKKTKK